MLICMCCVLNIFVDILRLEVFFFFFFNDTATTEIYTLSLHDALPICSLSRLPDCVNIRGSCAAVSGLKERRASSRLVDSARSEEHTSELQSPCNLVCRLLLEKKKRNELRLSAILH